MQSAHQALHHLRNNLMNGVISQPCLLAEIELRSSALREILHYGTIALTITLRPNL